MKINTILFCLFVMVIMTGCQHTTIRPTTIETQSTPTNKISPTFTISTPFLAATNMPQETHIANQQKSQTPIPFQQISVTSSPTSELQKIVPNELREYIGIVYPPIPIGMREGGPSGIIFSPNGIPNYLLEGFYKEDIHMLWFSKFDKREAQGSYWQVLDILILPKLENDEVFIPSGCMINGKLDDELIAIGILDEESYISRYLSNDYIKYVWKANRAAEVFEKLSTTGIECYADQATTW